jgi:hypothetical protein
LRKMEARVGIEPTHKGFADLSLTAWVPRHFEQVKEQSPSRLRGQTLRTQITALCDSDFGAGDGGRTRDFDLGKVALYH